MLGTKTFLEEVERMRVVGTGATGAEALALVAATRPDVLILDVLLPDGSGVDVTRRVRAAAPEVAVLAVTGSSAEWIAAELDRAGAQGLLRKGVSLRDLASAVRLLAAGHTLRIPCGTPAAGSAALTPREREVLGLIVLGLRNREIAAALNIGEDTVETHLTHIYEKLGVHSRSAPAQKARLLGLGPESRPGGPPEGSDHGNPRPRNHGNP